MMLMEVVLLLLLIGTLFKSLFLLPSLPLSLPPPPPVLSTTIYMPHPSIMIVRGRERCGQKKLRICFTGLSLIVKFFPLSPPSLSLSPSLSSSSITWGWSICSAESPALFSRLYLAWWCWALLEGRRRVPREGEYQETRTICTNG